MPTVIYFHNITVFIELVQRYSAIAVLRFSSLLRFEYCITVLAIINLFNCRRNPNRIEEIALNDIWTRRLIIVFTFRIITSHRSKYRILSLGLIKVLPRPLSNSLLPYMTKTFRCPLNFPKYIDTIFDSSGIT